MANKFFRYLFVEPKCRFRLVAVGAAIVAIVLMLWHSGKQAKQLAKLEKRSGLIGKTEDMEKELRKKAQLEAFRNQSEDASKDSVTFTKISGVAMQKGGTPSVVIDGDVYNEGSEFGEYIVTKITPEVITLTNKATKAIKKLYVFDQAQ